MYYLQSRYYDPETGRFINSDDISLLGADGTPLSYNLFSYCKNNPTNNFDASGKFALSAFLGAVVGGAIGGAIISTVSHVVNCAINGQELTASGLANAAITGAVTGAIGGAIGSISLASATATVVVKGVASAAVGIAMGIKTGIETDGSSEKKWATGITTGLITAGSTFLGAQIEAYDDAFGFIGNVFTNSSATLFVGVPAEIVSAGAQQGINAVENSAKSSCSSQSHYSSRKGMLARTFAY